MDRSGASSSVGSSKTIFRNLKRVCPDELFSAGGQQQNLALGDHGQNRLKAPDLLTDERSWNHFQAFQSRLIQGQFCRRGSNRT